MKLITACRDILDQLTGMLAQIRDEDYSRGSVALSGSSIGQHLRHTLEFFVCLENGFEKGVINYDKRSHDKSIETDKTIALVTIERVYNFLQDVDLDKPLHLEVNYNIEQDETETLNTTGKRELVYNIEHAVHHMALIKIGIRELAPYVELNKEFGVAASTIRYNEKEIVIR
jgi:uncharacterized damage-inducible protein DinB